MFIENRGAAYIDWDLESPKQQSGKSFGFPPRRSSDRASDRATERSTERSTERAIERPSDGLVGYREASRIKQSGPVARCGGGGGGGAVRFVCGRRFVPVVDSVEALLPSSLRPERARSGPFRSALCSPEPNRALGGVGEGVGGGRRMNRYPEIVHPEITPPCHTHAWVKGKASPLVLEGIFITA